MEERRQFVRLDTRLEMSYNVLPAAKAQPTVSKNIGGGGICIFSDQVLEPGTRLNVSMKLPDQPRVIAFIGEVIWSEPYEVIGQTQRQRAVEVGLQFVEIADQDRDAILQHVILTFKPPSTTRV